MIEEFFGKPFRLAMASLIALAICSAISYFANIGFVFLGLLTLITVVATFRKLEYGLAIAFLELMSNAHGYIFFQTGGPLVVSARMIIFLAVFIGWGLAILLRRTKLRFCDERMSMFLLLGLAIVCGFVIGFLRRNPVAVFQDGNAYLYLAYLLPVMNVEWTTLKQRVALQMLAAGTVFSAISSIAILYAYTHFSEPFLKALYVFLRDIRFAEITRLDFGMYRIFEQTQFFAVIFGLLLIPRLFFDQSKQDRRLTVGSLVMLFVVTLIGMSRSFWFGLIAALFVILLALIFIVRPSIKQALRGVAYGMSAMILSVLLLLVTVAFPWPNQSANHDSLSEIFGSRLGASDVAVSSRWNLLTPMLAQIKESPILGNGFAQTITYKTDDPRVRAIHPDGTWTTYSLEWGWFELWLKMGILAPIGFIALFVAYIRRSRQLFGTPKVWIGVWVIASMSFLYMTHVFSPYLNHPIGLGTILLLCIFFPDDLKKRSFSFALFCKQKMSHATHATSPVAAFKSK